MSAPRPAFATAVVAACTAMACAPPPASPTPTPLATNATGAAGAFQYRVEVAPGCGELSVALDLPPGPALDLAVEDGGERFVRTAAFTSAGGAVPLAGARDGRGEGDEPIGPCFHVPACARPPCRVAYRFDLAAAARSLDDPSVASEQGGAYLAPPSTWLLHPELSSEGRAFTLEVKTPRGVAFASGLLPGPGDGVFRADLSDLPKAPYGAIGPLQVARWSKGGFSIDVARLPGPLGVDDAALLRWVDRAASVVLGWARRPPIARALVLVVPQPGRGIGFARTLGNGGASVMVPLGEATTEADLMAGWELVHELLHVAFPNLPNEQSWFEEGMATYVEPFARARAGLVTEAEVWERLARRLPFGVPEAGAPGLDGVRSWGRVYWGGALFCLMADVEIRRRTAGARSLDDALRAVLAEGGNVSRRWEVGRVLEVGDRATGTRVLAELYAKHGAARGDVDLDALLRSLGVVWSGGTVKLDDGAPLASLRRAMVAP